MVLMASDDPTHAQNVDKNEFSIFKPKGNPTHYITGVREDGNAAGENALSTTNPAKRKKRKEQGPALLCRSQNTQEAKNLNLKIQF